MTKHSIKNNLRLGTFVLFALIATTVAAQHTKQLIIVHTNDTHSRIEPTDKNAARADQADKGGYARRSVFIDSVRQSNMPMILLDCGDFSQGTPYYTIFRGDVEIDLMNKLGYDAGTIGNHEFDYGMDNMLRLFRRANFPIVCSNYDFTGTMLEGVVKPYTVINRGGIRIGIIGLGPVLKGLVFKKHYQGIKFCDPVETTNRYAKLLREKMKCDLVVVISHLGYKMDEGYPSDFLLVPQIRGVDMVLGGHTHTFLATPTWLNDADGKKVPISQMGKNGQFVGTMTVNFTKK